MERKVKYNYEFKLRCVQEVLKNNRSIRSVAKENNFTESNLRKWVNLYKHYGKQGLLPKMNQYYSIDFKLKVLKKNQEKSLSLIEACLFLIYQVNLSLLNGERIIKNMVLQA